MIALVASCDGGSCSKFWHQQMYIEEQVGRIVNAKLLITSTVGEQYSFSFYFKMSQPSLGASLHSSPAASLMKIGQQCLSLDQLKFLFVRSAPSVKLWLQIDLGEAF